MSPVPKQLFIRNNALSCVLLTTQSEVIEWERERLKRFEHLYKDRTYAVLSNSLWAINKCALGKRQQSQEKMRQ